MNIHVHQTTLFVNWGIKCHLLQTLWTKPWLWNHIDADSNPTLWQLHFLGKLPHLLILNCLMCKMGITLSTKQNCSEDQMKAQIGTFPRLQKLL